MQNDSILHIAIDAHSIGAQLAGNETYAVNLIEALAEIDQSNRYTLYVTKPSAIDRFANRWPNFKVKRTLPHTPLVRIPLTLSAELRRNPVDILHVQYTAPPFPPCPVVATIHDLSFEHLPDTFNRRSRAQLRLTVRRTARNAARILTLSEFSRSDIVETYKIDPTLITITPAAAPPHFKPVENKAELRRIRTNYRIERDYILALGSIQPRKNLVRLIEETPQADLLEQVLEPAVVGLEDRVLGGQVHRVAAVQAVAQRRAGEVAIKLCRMTEIGEQHRQRANMPQLVIAGKRGWLETETIRAAQQTAANNDILFIGYVGEADLPALYSGAICFAYPSYFEGFGLPVLEAMQCGTPVIAANRTSLPEVVGDAGMLVDPFDETSIANALNNLIENPDYRADLRVKGIERAEKFGWKRTARLTLQAYERAAGHG